jgi:hypothetical protein
VDRVAVVVGETVFTESEVLEEVRVTEFLNGETLDLSPQKKREAGERLVDQQLIRQEMEIGGYPSATQTEVESTLRDFEKLRSPNPAAFHAELQKYGITEEQLKKHLEWQLAALRFTEARFRVGVPAASSGSADRLRAGSVPIATSVDDQMDAWLKQARSTTRIEFKKEAFQ